MDANRKQTFPALLAGCGLMFAAAINADADVRIAAYTDNEHIEFSGDDIVITADDQSQARITPVGDLRIAGKPVSLNATQRTLLVQYADGIHGIAHQGMRIGSEGARMAVDILGDVFGALMDGDSAHEIDAKAEAHAAGIKATVRVLCDDLRSVQGVQTRLVGALTNFQPYAVITDDSVGKCYDGLNHDED